MENLNEKKEVTTNNKKVEQRSDDRRNQNNHVSPYESLMKPFLSLFGDDLFDEVTSESGLMRTDINEKDDSYEFEIEVPGVEKSQVKVGLDNGYLMVSYKTEEKNTKEEGKKKIHSERITGYYKREFFVGYNVKKEDIKAKMENGILFITVPKNKTKEDSDKFIAIE